MANCVNCQFSLNFQLFSVVLKSAPVKYVATYCPSHQKHSSCTSMSLWWQNDPRLWLSWTVSIPNWVSILWHTASAPSYAKLLKVKKLHKLVKNSLLFHKSLRIQDGYQSAGKFHKFLLINFNYGNSYFCLFTISAVDIAMYNQVFTVNTITQKAKFLGPTWGPPGSCRPQMGLCWHHRPCYQGICHEYPHRN